MEEINAIKNKIKSSLIFTLEFTTSKLLSYIVVIASVIVGYLLTSPEVVMTGLVIGAALAGVKNISESWIKAKSISGTSTTDTSSTSTTNTSTTNNPESTKEIL